MLDTSPVFNYFGYILHYSAFYSQYQTCSRVGRVWNSTHFVQALDFFPQKAIYKRMPQLLFFKSFYYLNLSGKLGGMNENKETVAIPEARVTPEGICRCVRTVGNLLQVPSSQSDVYFFAAQTLATSTLVLVSVKVQSKSSKVTVNCEKMVIGTMLTKDLKRALTSAAES